ncbi:HEAT repeat domain-containing protein, partial [Glycomyces tenuis]|uniref:HEAT repeat domain-containing protein n=1 Tax=Glycomyces tenuis TaxID=58116 RepID=UPI001B807ACD
PADRLAPRVCEYLRGIDLAGPHPNSEANPALFALGALGDPAALPTIAEVLTAAIRLEQWPVVRSALASSRRFGAAAPDALDDIRPLTSAPDQGVVQGAIEVIWTRTGDPAEVLPRLATLLDSDDSFTMIGAADVLAEIGPAAASSLPRLRTLLSHRYEWVRVHAAAAMWAIGGENETDVVLDVLCRAWEQNLATGNHVTECLDRMGTAAGPAVPMVRAELALARRSGRFGGIEHDEALQRTCRAIARRFG